MFEKQDMGGKAELLWLLAKGSGIWLLGLTFDMRGARKAQPFGHPLDGRVRRRHGETAQPGSSDFREM
jgi:hypothetical protein